MERLEKEIEAKLRVLVERRGGLCLKWVCPGWAGVPDRIILLPGARVLFVETKRPKGGRLSSLQVWWGRKLTQLGFKWYTVCNEYELEKFEGVIEK